MGFRSTFCMQDYAQEWPNWFRDKYSYLNIPDIGPITTQMEIKIYTTELFDDVRKACLETGSLLPLRVAILHECGGVTLCDITESGLVWSESCSFEVVSFITHSYCYECTTPANAPDQRPASAGPLD